MPGISGPVDLDRFNGTHPAGLAAGALTALVMTETRQILFIQGAGEGTYDEWDDKLVDSLRRALGDGVRGPLPADARRG